MTYFADFDILAVAVDSILADSSEEGKIQQGELHIHFHTAQGIQQVEEGIGIAVH